MQKKSLQQKLILLTGNVLIPVSLLFLFFRYHLWNRNFTGLLSDVSLFPWIHLYGICLLCFVFCCLYRKVNFKVLIVYVILVLCTFLFPYADGGLFRTLHLLFGYGSFLVYQYLWLSLIYYEQHLLNWYFFGCFLCVLIVFQQYQISGIPEILYAVMMSILLTKKVV